MNGELRAEIAFYLYKWATVNSMWGDPTLLADEANGRPVSLRRREVYLRRALAEVDDSVRREGYSPSRDRDSYDHRAVLCVLDEALMPFLISVVPALASEFSTPWDSPRGTVRAIMKDLDLIKDDFLEIDWPVVARALFYDQDRPIRFNERSNENWNKEFGTPGEFFRNRLASRLDELRDIISEFFFDDPLGVQEKIRSGSSSTPDQRASAVQKVQSSASTPCPVRAAWLIQRLQERGWNKYDLAAHNGPDHKTTQKILNGVPVGTNVLDKVARALSAKRGFAPVSMTDIPRE